MSLDDDVDVTIFADGSDPTFDEASGTTTIILDDGDVEVVLGELPPERKDSGEFDENIAEVLSGEQLAKIADTLLQAIERDEQSRAEWLENMSAAISLLGLQIKNPKGAATSGASPTEGTSVVDHPVLLEATLRFQANARGELLPTDGPVKVRNDAPSNALTDELAEALEKDLNHFLTKVAKEYVPDTDRMLLLLGFSGISFKKGFHDAVKRRPVIESIDAQDLIVSNAATHLEGSGRVTHRIMMRPSMVRRMQIAGAYRQTKLQPMSGVGIINPVATKIAETQGIALTTPGSAEYEDLDREIFECYCEMEIPGFEHEFDGEQTGLPLPYKVSIDKDSRAVLEIRRHWDQDDPFCLPKNRIIAYKFIPGLGFYGIGLLNVLGNAAKALTAAWRLTIDAGMFGNFPGFLYLKSLAKQLTNQFRIPPGGGMPIDTNGGDITKAVMPLPYKSADQVFINFIQSVTETAQRVGGTAELQIGEGKQDAPVGTTLALIEQATKMMSAVHKRCHESQAMEFEMLKDLLMEDPEALWRHNRKRSQVLACLLRIHPAAQAMADQVDASEEQRRSLFLAALADADLVPRSDPNTSSQTERYLKASAMRQMAATNLEIDMTAVDKRIFRVMGIDDGDSLFKPPPAPGAAPPSPEMITAQATATAAQARLQEAQTKAKSAQMTAQMMPQELQAKKDIANTQVARELVIHNSEQQDAQAQREHDATQASADRIHALALANLRNRGAAHTTGIANLHKANESGIARAHEAQQSGIAQAHEANQAALDRQHEIATMPAGPQGVAP